ncbi:aminoglycoside phosphotransferase family protein [Mycoplasmatota bacterium WC44]
MDNIVKEILELEGIKYSNITKSDSGFSNQVYFIDDLYVIKMMDHKGNKIKLLNEIGFYKNISMSSIPKYITSGNYNNSVYLIIEKLKGKPLYEIWHTLTTDERNDISSQIANILKEFNSQKEHSFLSRKHIRSNSIDLWTKAFKKNIDILDDKGFDTVNLLDFMENKISIIFKEDKLGLVYNDAHFDNFLYDGKKVKVIDFDRVLYGSIDYELLILKMMINNPKKFANEIMEQYVEIDDFDNIMPIIQEGYKELFQFKYLDDRVFIYSFFYTLRLAYRFELNELIGKLLDGFNSYFYNC